MPQRRKGLCLSRGCLRELQRHWTTAKKVGDTDTFIRIRGIVVVSEGYSSRDTGDILDVTSGSVSNGVARDSDGGPDALATQTRSGRPRTLCEDELCAFEEIIDAGAISNQRQFRFRVQTVYFNQVTFTEFLSYFRDHVHGYVIMIVAGASYPKGPLVKDFLWKHRKSFEREYLPAYSPERNPQEDVWKTFRKNHTHNRCCLNTDDLLTATRSGLRSLQRSNVLDGVYLECQHSFL